MAAEEEHSPIIIQFGPGQMKNHAHMEEMIPIVRELAARVHVPVALNLDHGSDFYVITDCINAGFTNVMFDGSSLPYEENVKRSGDHQRSGSRSRLLCRGGTGTCGSGSCL